MKKLSAILFVVLVAISLSACQTFYNSTTDNYPQKNPLEMTVFLKAKKIPVDSTVDTEFTQWCGDVLTQFTSADENAIKITDITLREVDANSTCTVDLIVNNVPDSTLQKTVRPFKITYTQIVYNPIALLPDSDVFTYMVAYSAQRRHSAANAMQKTTTDDGNYLYLWTTGEPIQFVDVYPNRPLYYLIVVVGAAILGTVVYLVSRYYDCKKRKNQL